MKHVRLAFFLFAVAGAAAFAACATTNDQNLPTGTGQPTGAGGSTGSGCQACLSNAQCASGSDCAQFAGDQWCAEDCASAACDSAHTCMVAPGADGNPYHVCVPNSNMCSPGHTTSSGGGGAPATTTTSSGAMTTTTVSSSSSSGSPDTCSHSPCATGAALTTGCDGCATQVCASDPYCCTTKWNAQCVSEAMAACGPSCGSGTTTTTTTSSSSTTSSSTSGAPGTVGPGGGSLATLSFAIVGDTRPPNEDDTSGYPTSVITKIYQDIQAASPRPAFAITTGDYMFSSPSKHPGTQQAQMNDYMGARAAFSNVLFPTMGNHECDGATADNCYACGSACSNVGGTCVNNVCQTPNFQVFQSALLAPINQNLPYYVINVNSTNNTWTSKFVFIACNMWSSTQASWLASALSTPTTYTFVVRHEGTDATTAPCLSGSGSNNADTIISQHPHTLLIAGHTHTYAYYSSEKQVIVGNGGAPLSGSVNYGYVIARQQGSSIVFNEYDYSTNAVKNTFTVQ